MDKSYNTLWNKGIKATEEVEDFTVGQDRTLDLRLARYDVIGSKAHIKMLSGIGLLPVGEEMALQKSLDDILNTIAEGKFQIEEGIEDIHSQIELMLTRELGEIGKKIHSGRSRNDQVLVDIKLFLKDEVKSIRDEVLALFDNLLELSKQYKDILLPGYTHSQIAMPSSFGLWFGAYAETLVDDMSMLKAAYTIVDQNPLGSAAGYGSSFPLDREMTTELLGFSTMNFNSIAAQMSRGKSEKAVAAAAAAIASTLNKLSADCCQYMCANYGFISFPDSLTTGSSIMPHKKNPDVWEIVRGKSNRIQGVPNDISLLCTNLPHGYHRDFQLLKDILFPSLEDLHACLKISYMMLSNIKVNENILKNHLYDYLFTVEEVNRLVLEEGMTFRDAYVKVGKEVQEGKFHPDIENARIRHTHTGSISNPGTSQIKNKMQSTLF